MAPHVFPPEMGGLGTCDSPTGSIDYYGILGLDPDATDEDVRRAYRGLALQNHPDKCHSSSAADMFKTINRAYDVLSDPTKRTAYDLHGEEGLHEIAVDENTAAAEAFNSSDTDGGHIRQPGGRPASKISPVEARQMFERLFGSRPLSGMFAGARTNAVDDNYVDATCQPQQNFVPSGRQAQAEVIERPLMVTLEELEVGTTKRFKILNGDGIAEVLQLDVKPGWTEGTRILFPGKGGRGKSPGAPMRDLVFVIQQLQHPIFRRENNNLAFDIQVPLVVALCGGDVTIPQFGSRPAMNIRISPGMDVNSVVVLSGRGMPNPNGGPPGDLKVCLKLILPRDLSAAQMEQIRSILQPQTGL